MVTKENFLEIEIGNNAVWHNLTMPTKKSKSKPEIEDRQHWTPTYHGDATVPVGGEQAVSKKASKINDDESDWIAW